MIKEYENKKLKLNTSLGKYPKGMVIDIKVDKAGTPLDKYWRDRIKDSTIDNCVEFTKPSGKISEVTSGVKKGLSGKSKKAKKSSYK